MGAVSAEARTVSTASATANCGDCLTVAVPSYYPTMIIARAEAAISKHTVIYSIPHLALLYPHLLKAMMKAAIEKEAKYRELRKQQALSSPPPIAAVEGRKIPDIDLKNDSDEEVSPITGRRPLSKIRRRNMSNRRYQRLRTIGSGSFGAVYSADDTHTGETQKSV